MEGIVGRVSSFEIVLDEKYTVYSKLSKGSFPDYKAVAREVSSSYLFLLQAYIYHIHVLYIFIYTNKDWGTHMWLLNDVLHAGCCLRNEWRDSESLGGEPMREASYFENGTTRRLFGIEKNEESFRQ